MTACRWDVLHCGTCTAYDNLAPEVQAIVDAWAVDKLWLWTRQRFGLCEVPYRPCKDTCMGGMQNWPIWPVLDSGRFTNLSCGSCGDNCSCKATSKVILPGPIDSIVEILVDGDPLPEDAAVVYDYNMVVRVDGGRFPTCQNIGSLPDEPGTWQITIMQGEPVPPGGDLVAGVLACEYAKAVCNDNSCRLPKTLTTSQRQGVTIVNMARPESIQIGVTGIWEIDDWVSNQNNPMRQSLVTSPDIPKQRRMTWSSASS